MKVSLTVNGQPKEGCADDRMLLVELLRDVVGLKGARVGCLTGDCGACTVLLNGALHKSCLVLAVAANGTSIETVESGGETLDALRHSFISGNGFQCGYCTSGMLMTALDLLTKNPDPDEAEIRQAISGNLCRCTGYGPIVNAIKEAAKTVRRANVQTRSA